jgi:hypothetical protein
MSVETLFTKYRLKPGNSQEIQLGKLSIQIEREEQGWYVHSYVKEDSDGSLEKGEFYQTGPSDTILLAPALQAKPVVIKGNKLIVSPAQKLNFFIKVPLVVQVYHTSKKAENLLKEISYARLSDTWFGEPDNGEPAYAVNSEYSLSIENLDPEGFEVICPINVVNNSDKPLELQRLIIRVENLSLFFNNEKIISSLVKIEYKGKDSVSVATYGSSKLLHGEKPQILAKPRTGGQNGSLKINFHFIRNIYKNM